MNLLRNFPPSPPFLHIPSPNPTLKTLNNSQQQKQNPTTTTKAKAKEKEKTLNKNSMVVATPLDWLPDIAGSHITKKTRHHQKSPPATLEILAFETAKIMSRLVSLYKSLSDHEVNNLKKEVMQSQGVAFLNSKDEGFLLNLACAERLEELDYAAIAISRLGRKCTDFGLTRFDLVYRDLKLGILDMGKVKYGSKEIVKIVEKMDKFIWSTATLYSSLESLAEMETSERKINQWRKNLGQGGSKKVNFDLFDQKIAFQRKQARHLKDVSLWSQTFNKSVGLMARIICIVYARICYLFGPYISGLPQFSSAGKIGSTLKSDIIPPSAVNHCLLKDQPKIRRRWKSGPIPVTAAKMVKNVRFHSKELNLYSMDDIGFGNGRNDIFGQFNIETGGKTNKVLQAALPSTVGGAGLTIRYANVIIMAEKYLNTGTSITDEERDQMYEMLPDCLKLMVGLKLGKAKKKEEEEDELLAEGWREAVKALMEWLGPIAHDTVKWHTERNLEKQKIDAKPTVLLLQTLHYSDREKTEAAITEVLVGLSFICRYGKCYSADSSFTGWDSDTDT